MEETALFVFQADGYTEFHKAEDVIERLEETAPNDWPSQIVFLEDGTVVNPLGFYAASQGA